MHALVYTGTNKIDFREEKDPITKPGETLVKVKASGICGSDMHAFHGNDERRIPPLILGHEVSGTSLDGKFKNKDVVIVIPDLEIPGIIATAWAKPIIADENKECFLSLLLNVDEKIKISPVAQRA